MSTERYVQSIEDRAERDLAMMTRIKPAPMASAVKESPGGSQNSGATKVARVASLESATMQPCGEAIEPPVILSVAELLARTFPARDRLLSPWLTTQSLSMIYATRGTGKTHVALGIAYALASGGEFLTWCAERPVKVLYIDGEMPGADLQKRLSAIIASSPHEASADHLRIVTPDVQPMGVMPNLYTPEGQEAIAAAIGDAQVIIVDNISCLVRGGKENEGESWQPVATWSLLQRAAGRSVVFIHHAGKGSEQRGTSKREDLLDVVIKLARSSDYNPADGAHFEVHFEKARALCGEAVAPFEAKLETLSDGATTWTTRKVVDAMDERIVEMVELGMNGNEMAVEMDVDKSTISRALRRLRDEGRVPEKKAKPNKRKLIEVVRDHTEPSSYGDE